MRKVVAIGGLVILGLLLIAQFGPSLLGAELRGRLTAQAGSA